MKTPGSLFALALALAFTGPAFAGDVTNDPSRLREGWRHVGCRDQQVLREEDVGPILSVLHDARARASAGALLL